MRWSERVRQWPRPLRIAIGVALLILGALGLFLPVLQGLLFLTLGAWLLSKDVPIFARWKRKFVAWRRARRERRWLRINSEP